MPTPPLLFGGLHKRRGINMATQSLQSRGLSKRRGTFLVDPTVSGLH